MHFVLIWNINISAGPERQRIDEDFRSCLKGYSWVRPLSSTYIVKIKDEESWAQIRAQLVEICKGNQKSANFIMSPVMDGGRYAGWLPKALWEKIKARTE